MNSRNKILHSVLIERLQCLIVRFLSRQIIGPTAVTPWWGFLIPMKALRDAEANGELAGRGNPTGSNQYQGGNANDVSNSKIGFNVNPISSLSTLDLKWNWCMMHEVQMSAPDV